MPHPHLAVETSPAGYRWVRLNITAIDGSAGEVYARAIAVLNTPSAARRELPDLPLTVLYDEIWQNDGSLRERFDVDRQAGRLAYLRWLIERGDARVVHGRRAAARARTPFADAVARRAPRAASVQARLRVSGTSGERRQHPSVPPRTRLGACPKGHPAKR